MAFTADDRRQMQALGISEARLREQIRLFQKPAYFCRLNRPCTPGDGLHQIAAEEGKAYLALQEKAAREGRFQNFIPASGAATRMFQDLYQGYHQYPAGQLKEIATRGAAADPPARALLAFMADLPRFPFYEDLEVVMAGQGLNLADLHQQGRFRDILHYLLNDSGLNYGALPKGLLKFHRYADGSRTAFEEHLVEAAQYVRDGSGVCRLHFTISPEHLEIWEQYARKLIPAFSQRHNNRLALSFSVQKPATATIAVDLRNRPFRENGRLLFRPGGHGALLDNLNELAGDLVYIKNIDNIVPDRLKEPTITWKRILGGYLVSLETAVHQYLRKLAARPEDRALMAEALDFARERLFLSVPEGFRQWVPKRRRDFLYTRFNRPLRVCGMVKNEGEPGGGPFWVQGQDGRPAPQIVEQTQVDHSSPQQQAIWAAATHFNPVDLVCALRDYQGTPFDVRQYVDQEAVIISRKSTDGRELKALELPGLWNGAMAAWLTVFVEVPPITFNPVKTVFDLLRPQHQPS